MMRNVLLAALVVCLLGATTGCCGLFSSRSCLPQGRLVTNKDAPTTLTAAAGAITADGNLTEAAWYDNTIRMTDFVWGSNRAEVRTNVLVTYDQQNLYVAVICDEPNTSQLRANTQTRDGNVWNDDSVEVYVDAGNQRGTEYHGFFVNSRNVVYDRMRDDSWSGTWSSGTSVTPGVRWIAELAIPWSTIGVTPRSGHRLGLMVQRVRFAGVSQAQWLQLAPCGGEAKDTTKYPVLQLP